MGEADDWVVLATTSAAEGAISEEERQTFLDAEEKLRELDALTTKMRKKCQAHEELQRRRRVAGSWQFGRAKLPQKGCCEVLLRRVAELQGTATYGCNMLQKVSNLLERFDAARERFTAEVVPRFAPPVAAAEAEEVLREEWAQQQVVSGEMNQPRPVNRSDAVPGGPPVRPVRAVPCEPVREGWSSTRGMDTSSNCSNSSWGIPSFSSVSDARGFESSGSKQQLCSVRVKSYGQLCRAQTPEQELWQLEHLGS
eukprot:g11235.t1